MTRLLVAVYLIEAGLLLVAAPWTVWWQQNFFVDLVQVRERDLDAAPLAMFTRGLVARAGRTRILVNDRADVAFAAGAHGVHLRASSVPADRVRAVGAGWVVGQSIHEGDGVIDA